VTGFSGAMTNLQHVAPEVGSRHTHCEIPSWFAIQTWPQYEKKVATEFHKKDIEAFLPLLSSKRRWSDRSTTVQVPLFPSYVFVRIDESSNARIGVLRTNGVTGFVGVRGRGIAIPEVQIESVRLLVASGIPFQHHPLLAIGERVRIRGGSLDGVEGTLLAKNDDLSLLVSVQIIQRSLSIRVAGYRIEPIQSKDFRQGNP
jgi:transcription antitermination factor NusG